MQEGDTDFVREHHNAYNFALAGDYLKYEGYLNTDHYLNAVTVAAVLEEFEQCEKLIQEAAIRPNEEVENVKKIAKAYLYFYKKEINESYDLLQTVKSNKLNYKLRIRSLQIQCLYELFLCENDADSVITEAEAYRQFILREEKDMEDAVYFYDKHLTKMNQ